MAAITVDEQTSAWPPRNLVSVTGLVAGDDVEVYREVAGARTLVRAGSATDVSDPSFVRVDAEFPFGVPVHYVAVVNGADAASAGPDTYTLPGGKVALSDAITGLAAEVVVLSWPDKTRERDATIFRVGTDTGASRNVVVARGLSQPTGVLDLVTQTASALDQLVALLAGATQNIVQLRQPGGYHDVDMYAAVVQAVTRRWSQDGTDERRITSLTYAEVDGWSAELANAGYTLQDIADVYAGQTLADLAGDYATLLDIAQGEFIP